MNNRIVAIGECMVELSPGDSKDQFSLSFAGDTFNTIWYLKKLNPRNEINYFTRVGEDEISDRMLQFFEEHGIGTDFIKKTSGKTVGLYMISLKDGERSFSYWRGQSAARDLASDKLHLEQSLSDAKLIYFSGITLAILSENGRTQLIDALKAARRSGSKIAFDPNLRPKLWPDLITMCHEVMRAASVSDIILPSHEDEASFFGDQNPTETLHRYLEAGSTTVVVKNGAGEILFAHNGENGVHHPVPVERVIDTTAAGDSFNAGFLAGLEENKSIGDVISDACALAAKVIGGQGALVDFHKN